MLFGKNHQFLKFYVSIFKFAVEEIVVVNYKIIIKFKRESIKVSKPEYPHITFNTKS